MTLIRRLTLIVVEGRIEDLVYPVFPPDRGADLALERIDLGWTSWRPAVVWGVWTPPRWASTTRGSPFALAAGAPRSDAALVRAAQRGSERAVEELFARHWPARYRDRAAGRARRAPPPRTSRRRRSCPRCARCRGSTAAARCGRGCTGSSSTARSTGRARARCAAEVAAEAPPRSPPRAGPTTSGSARSSPRSPRCRPSTAPSSCCATCSAHAGRDRRRARPPARHRELAPAPRARRARRRARGGARERAAPARRAPGRPDRRRGRARRARCASCGPRTPSASRSGAAPLGAGARGRGVRARRGGRRGGSAPRPATPSARWVREVLGGGRDDARPGARARAGRRPAAGELRGAASAWVVSADGSRRRLGDYAGASWSPHGLFVVAWRGRRAAGVEPGGRVRWSLSRRGRDHGRALGAGRRLPDRLPVRRRAARGRGRRDRRPPARRGAAGRARLAAGRRPRARLRRPAPASACRRRSTAGASCGARGRCATA